MSSDPGISEELRPPTLPGLRRSAVGNIALFLGIGLLMLGTGLGQSLVGVRSTDEGFGTAVTGFVLGFYYAGYLLGSLGAPPLILRVGHIRVFTALASAGSAAVLLHPVLVDPTAWMLIRLVSGACTSGLFVVAESWLNDASTNEIRGRLLSVYMIVVLGGLGTGQLLLNTAPVSGATLFIVSSVLVSLAIVPVALVPRTGPPIVEAPPASLAEVFHTAPLGVVGSVAGGAVTGALLGFGAVYGAELGLSVVQISVFMAATVFGGALLQWPLGALSDHVERRQTIVLVGTVGAVAAVAAAFAGTRSHIPYLVVLAGLVGGLGLPLYSLSVAHSNDYLESDRIVGATSVLVLCNGAGAVTGPILAAAAMAAVGPRGFFWLVGTLLATIAVYAVYRITRRSARPREARVPYAAVPLTATPTISELNPAVHDPGAVTERTVGGAVPLHVVEQGTGEPVVFVHGAASSHRIWRSIMEELAAVGHRAVAYDLRGHGRSAPGAGGGLVEHTRDLSGILDDLEPARAHVVAQDEGGAIALEVALTDPRRVRSLSLAGALRSQLSDRGRGPFDLLRDRLVGPTSRRFAQRVLDPRRHPETYASLRADQRLAVRDRVQQLAADATFESFEPRLSELACPLMAAVGERDTDEAHRFAGLVAAAVSDGLAFEVPDCGRLVPIEAPAVFGRTLRHFLTRSERRADLPVD